MKVILAIDMPESCKECRFCGFGGLYLEQYVCYLTGDYSEDSHLVGCPLRPLPRKLDANDWHRMFDGLFSEREAKTVDAVPVIRCKDCEHWQCDDVDSYCDELGIFGTDMNSYCSYAKKGNK